MDIESLMKAKGFTPNPKQRECILHVDGPLFITAGPGSGKTKVLLWRTVNLIVFHKIDPSEIFLATFTEKAANQLKDGLRTLLSFASQKTKILYDISSMNLGTAHSIFRNILNDRRFSTGGARPISPVLMDSLGQYFFIKKNRIWKELWESAGYKEEEEANQDLSNFLSSSNYPSKSKSVADIISIFNRFSEESIDPKAFVTSDKVLKKILKMYSKYLEILKGEGKGSLVDFSALQKLAYERISEDPKSKSIFKHVIIDEYQDTNAIQEKIYFHLALGSKNICVVGDDDQALYRFRGATVENLVEFPSRSLKYFKCKPTRKDLNINYRSRKEIVGAYTSFIDKEDWKDPVNVGKYFRVYDKNIQAFSTDAKSSVVVSTTPESDYDSYEMISETCYNLLKLGKIENYNQIAFLFPSVKGNSKVKAFEQAFAEVNSRLNLTGTRFELRSYAPRANSFLETEEARAIWGLFVTVFDRPHFGEQPRGKYFEFMKWMEGCKSDISRICAQDPDLLEYLNLRKLDIENSKRDYSILIKHIEKKNWDLEGDITDSMVGELKTIKPLTDKCKKDLASAEKSIKNRSKQIENAVPDERVSEPYKLHYILKRVTSLDWTVLDFFYQCMGFAHFKKWFDLAERGEDEGPIVNLAQISKYLARFMEEFSSIISAPLLTNIDENHKNKFQLAFFSSFTYALFRLSETEVEDEENPFPKGRIAFLTIHQSKGLEFPVVVLGSLDKRANNNTKLEEIVRKGLGKNGEPIDRIGRYDSMRLFYVALSRAKNLLILNVPEWTRQRSPSRVFEPFRTLIPESEFECLEDLDLKSIPDSKMDSDDLGKSYSYTADYLHYERCPRQYMIVRKYGFAESRSQTMLFGSLVHQTIEDLHYLLMHQRGVI